MPRRNQSAWPSATTRPTRPIGIPTSGDCGAHDLGDVGGHLTDVTVAHAKIEAAVAAACTIEPRFIPVMIGGDHSVTAPAVRGFCAANPDKRVGIINIDAHLDVRNFEHGPHNGTPFRAILTGDLPIEGRNVVELGIHGFMNAANYMQWAREQGVTVISGREFSGGESPTASPRHCRSPAMGPTSST